MATKKTKAPPLGQGAILFDSVAQRDECGRLSGWTPDPTMGDSLGVYVYGRGHGSGVQRAVPYPATDPARAIAATGRQVLSALRSGRGWPGLSASGYSLTARVMHRTGSGLAPLLMASPSDAEHVRSIGFGCWVGTLHQAKRVLAEARAHARDGRSSRSQARAGVLGLTFAGRPVSSVNSRGGISFGNEGIRLDLPKLEALVLAGERHHRKGTTSATATAKRVRGGQRRVGP